MKKVLNKILLMVLAGLMISGCSDNRGQEENVDKATIRLTATTGMIGDALINITGERAQVEILMGSGVDPHLFKASQGDLKKLSQADIVFYNGLHLEGKMAEVLEKLARQKTVLAVANGVDKAQLLFSPEFPDTKDPHIWFDVKLWSQAVAYISESLQKADTAGSKFYKANTAAYLLRLDSLDAWVRNEINSIPEEGRVLITAHDAFGYFGRAYNIEVRGLQGISTLSDFGLRDITSLVDFISSRKIKAVFVETSVSPKAIQAVVEGCRKKGHEVKIGGTLYSDAMGRAGTPEGTYVGMVEANVRIIVEALK